MAATSEARRRWWRSGRGGAVPWVLGLFACVSEQRTGTEPERARAEARPTGTLGTSSGAGSVCGGSTQLPSGVSERRLTSGGVERRYLVYLPAGYDGRAALPLVLEFHGSGGTAEGQLTTSQLSAVADAERFAIVAPQAVGQRWNVPPDAAKPDDVRFVAEMLNAVERQVCIDRQRVYATGFSGGGRMSSQLACDLSERVAAIAAVGGLRFPGPCERARSMPVAAFHGTADTINPYDGGGQPYWGTSVEAAFDGWGRHNGCGPRRESRVAASVVQLAYGGSGCADVVLYRIEGFDHSWPGAIYSDRERGTANDLIWAFFTAHPLPATNTAPPAGR